MNESFKFINSLDIKYGDAVVAGISGGPDSMALLHMLVRLKSALDIQVVCAHVNHNVRKESAEELVFVKNYCRNNGIVFESMVIEDYGDDNFHNEAHSIRYNYFGQMVKKYGAKYLFTAHHGDDLMETILMRITRGSTLRGYSGFSKVVKKDNYTIVRPFINVTKDEILAYNKANKLKYVIDASNDKDVYTRNRFRKYIIPQFKREDSKVHDKFYKFSQTLLEYNDYIEQQVNKQMKKVYAHGILNIEEFLKLERVIGMKIIYHMLENTYQDDLMLISDKHAEIIYDLIKSKKTNSQVHLPNNIAAVKTYNSLVLEKIIGANDAYEIELDKYMSLPNGKNIEIVEKTKSDNNNVCRLNSNEIKLPLYVRSRHDGDKMTVKGMLGRKKINDIFIDNKVNPKDRDLWPILMDSDDNIVWLPGLKKSKFCKTKDEKYDIILRYY